MNNILRNFPILMVILVSLSLNGAEQYLPSEQDVYMEDVQNPNIQMNSQDIEQSFEQKYYNCFSLKYEIVTLNQQILNSEKIQQILGLAMKFRSIYDEIKNFKNFAPTTMQSLYEANIIVKNISETLLKNMLIPDNDPASLNNIIDKINISK